jgi:hypothetical protein
MLERDENPIVDAPIPGQSLTAPLGDRPWQQPARFSKADETLAFYIERITTPRAANQMFDILEMGVPIATLVDTMQLGGVMEGLHSVDVGVIISPALAEAIEGMAKAAEVKYSVTGTDPNDKKPDDTQISLALSSLAEEKVEASGIMEELQDEQPMQTAEPKGLMARRNSNGI